MHYFKKNIGDYAKKTGRLSMLQHGAYTLLIDSCYDRERFPTMDDAIEWTWASTTEEIEAVEFVLRRFFVLEDGLYVQSRIREEIAEYHAKATTNKRIAEEREAKRKLKDTTSTRTVNDSLPSLHEPTPNQEPLTINHKPIKNTATSVALPEGVSDSVWQEFKSLRKAKKAPITQRAIDAITTEANKAGWTLEKALEECVVRGWQAFKADWVATKANPADIVRLTVPSKNEPDPALEKIKADALKAAPMPESFRQFAQQVRKA